MKKSIFFSTMLCLITLFYCSYQIAHTDEKIKSGESPLAYFINNQNKPSPELLELLSLLNVAHDGTLESIVKETQKNWLRSPGKERWKVKKFALKKKMLLCSAHTN